MSIVWHSDLPRLDCPYLRVVWYQSGLAIVLSADFLSPTGFELSEVISLIQTVDRIRDSCCLADSLVRYQLGPLTHSGAARAVTAEFV